MLIKGESILSNPRTTRSINHIASDTPKLTEHLTTL